MRTNIVINQQLTNEAFALTGLKTKRELVEFALIELIKSQKKSQQNGLCDVFKRLHQLNLATDPFPEVTREDRPNPFVTQL